MIRFLAGLALIAALVLGPPLALAPVHADAPPRFCYNWGFLNSTAEDATGVVLHFGGNQAASAFYTGPWNPFGDPAPGSGYNPKTDTTTLTFSGGPAYTGDLVHLGLCTVSPTLRTSNREGTPLAWQVPAGTRVPPDPLFVGLRWTWAGRDGLQVELHNDQTVDVTLFTAFLLNPGTMLPLEDLIPITVDGLPPLHEFIAEPTVLPAGAMISFSYPPSISSAGAEANSGIDAFSPDQPLLLAVTLAADDDPGNTAHLYAQALSPLGLYLPMMLRNK